MKLSKDQKGPSSLLNNQKSPFRREKRSNTDRKKYLMLRSSSPVVLDPFPEINSNIRPQKLQPILLKERCSPNPIKQGKISIRLPEITPDGQLKTCRHYLPALNFPTHRSLGSPSSKELAILRFSSEKSLLLKNDSIAGPRNVGKTFDLDISFGNNYSEYPINPFNT